MSTELARDRDDVSTEGGLRPAPIDPAWVLRGAPEARVRELTRSSDGVTSSALWDCTAGSFRWCFAVEETVHVLAGEVVVTGEDGVVRVLRAGDVALFAAGTTATWDVPHYVRKLAFLRDVRGPLRRRAAALRTRLTTRG